MPKISTISRQCAANDSLTGEAGTCVRFSSARNSGDSSSFERM